MYDPNVTGALASLVIDASFSSQVTDDPAADYEATKWLSDDPMPSWPEVQAEIARIEDGNPTDASGYLQIAYREQRAPEYPPISELADAIYWNEQGDSSKLDAYVAACEAVKEKYPKPEES